MKILVAGTRGFPGVQGGVEKHCENLYPCLAQKGCEVVVFTRKPYVSNHKENFRGITLIPVDCPRNKFLEAFVHTFKCVLRSRKLSPDVLHIHAIGPSFFVPLARIMGMNVVVTNHGPDYMRKKWALPARIFLRFCERMGMQYANRIIAISANIADDIRRKYGRDASVIPNGVEIREVHDSQETLGRFGLQEGKYILAVGRLVPEKGFHDLIDAFSGKDRSGVKLVIAGDADHEDQYSRELKAKAGRCSNIVMTGYLEEQILYRLYSQAALFVLPSYHEGLPIALLEAMSFGVSCIASDIPANRNIKLDDRRYFRAGDIRSLTEKLEKYMSGTWSAEDREKQVAMIRDRYNWEKIADKTLEIYTKAAV